MKKLLAFAAIAETATSAALVVAPSVVVQLLFRAEPLGVACAVAHVTGIALISLGISCWSGKSPTTAASFGMTTYSLLVALYLIYLGIRGE